MLFSRPGDTRSTAGALTRNAYVAVYVSSAIRLLVDTCIAKGFLSFRNRLKIRLAPGIVFTFVLEALDDHALPGAITMVCAVGLSLLF